MYVPKVPISEPSWALPFRQIVKRALIDEDIVEAELARRLEWSPQRLNQYLRGKRRPGVLALRELREQLPNLPSLGVLIATVSDDEAGVPMQLIGLLESELTVEEMHGLIIEFRQRFIDELPAAAEKGKATGARKAKPRKPSPKAES